MWQVLLDRLGRVMPWLAHAVHVVRLAWASPRVRLGILGGLLALIALVVLWTRSGTAPPTPTSVVTDSGDQWHYLVVCEACGQRLRYASHPAATRGSPRNGQLVCPHCGAARAAWYRRGSQVVPPGGW
ncbi:MAG: hypothetical protein JXO22_03805 [Phycisphaerae bacterium]|nr:hypothetical protein [Phycisphaerae bacterium]